MKSARVVSIAVILFISLSCTKQDKTTGGKTDTVNSEMTSSAGLKFETKNLVKSYQDCKPGDENCTYISINYEILSSGENSEKINSAINDSLLKVVYVMDEKIPPSLDTALSNFMSDFEKFINEFKDAPQVWTSETNGKHVYYNENILSYEISNSSFTGGAHPNSFSNYMNFDLSNGNTLSLSGILSPGFENTLNGMIDKKYRELHNIKPDSSLQDAGLFENSITYNDNFAVTKDGLLFYYNNYEIAPYVMGPTEIVIPYTELGNLLNEKWGLK
jgi:hypothetical protein